MWKQRKSKSKHSDIGLEHLTTGIIIYWKNYLFLTYFLSPWYVGSESFYRIEKSIFVSENVVKSGPTHSFFFT